MWWCYCGHKGNIKRWKRIEGVRMSGMRTLFVGVVVEGR